MPSGQQSKRIWEESVVQRPAEHNKIKRSFINGRTCKKTEAIGRNGNRKIAAAS